MTHLTEEQRKQLDEAGYVLLPAVLSGEEIEQLLAHLERLWQEEGEAASSENYVEASARRLANLANKGDIFRAIYAHPLVLEAVAAVVGPDVRLSMLNARDARPFAEGRQPFHADTDSGGKPDDKGYYACTAVWMLDDFTPENGATRLIPGTHRSHQVPKEALADVFAPHPEEIALTGRRGDVLIFNGHCWHAGGQNQTNGPRRAILAHYFRAGIPRRPDRRQHLDDSTRAGLAPRELEILGLDDP
ncbi:MAG: phytanoyl-CoA dioxygenase family protein [Chloroflexi bacterium]|nr:phytanoyl-CoA dioxygenase family protein [Chloroflexota bacterium]MCI0643572.1 phytanoyl-CoA dioxygenase family protein [Chloroflexota bacterium]MCI0726194.1 phytanoyl-CoA dioxygenase family protein [Chloroflexota bacterium]